MSLPPASVELAAEPIFVPPARADLRPQHIRDAVIRLAGNSQDGIQSAGAMLARLAGRSAQEVMTYMTIPSTISGGPSIFQVRMGTGEVLSAGDEADFLVCFYQHSYEEHIHALKEGGVLLYDADHVTPDLNDRRFVYVGVPITGLTVEAIGGTAKDKGKNLFVMGLLGAVFHLDVDKLTGLIREKFFGKHEDVINNALAAFQAGYAYPVRDILETLYKFEVSTRTGGRPQLTMDGNQAIAYGLIAAGVLAMLTVTSDQNLFKNDPIHFEINVTADIRFFQKGQVIAQLTIPGKSGASVNIALSRLQTTFRSGTAPRAATISRRQRSAAAARPRRAANAATIARPGTYLLPRLPPTTSIRISAAYRSSSSSPNSRDRERGRRGARDRPGQPEGRLRPARRPGERRRSRRRAGTGVARAAEGLAHRPPVRGGGLGRGTNSAALAAELEPLGLPIHLVDEFRTTRRARELYFKEHPPRGRVSDPAGLTASARPHRRLRGHFDRTPLSHQGPRTVVSKMDATGSERGRCSPG